LLFSGAALHGKRRPKLWPALAPAHSNPPPSRAAEKQKEKWGGFAALYKQATPTGFTKVLQQQN